MWSAPVFSTFFVVLPIFLVSSWSLPLGLGHPLEYGASKAKVEGSISIKGIHSTAELNDFCGSLHIRRFCDSNSKASLLSWDLSKSSYHTILILLWPKILVFTFYVSTHQILLFLCTHSSRQKYRWAIKIINYPLLVILNSRNCNVMFLSVSSLLSVQYYSVIQINYNSKIFLLCLKHASPHITVLWQFSSTLYYSLVTGAFHHPSASNR